MFHFIIRNFRTLIEISLNYNLQLLYSRFYLYSLLIVQKPNELWSKCDKLNIFGKLFKHKHEQCTMYNVQCTMYTQINHATYRH